MSDVVYAWHFTGYNLWDGSPIPAIGEELRHDGSIEWHKTGLYASPRIIDALAACPHNPIFAHRVRCSEIERRDNYKFVCRSRTIVWSLPCQSVLDAFARQQAMSVAHLWTMPDVVREYLEKGRSDLRAEAASKAERNALVLAAVAIAERNAVVLAAVARAKDAEAERAWKRLRPVYVRQRAVAMKAKAEAAAAEAAWSAARMPARSMRAAEAADEALWADKSSAVTLVELRSNLEAANAILERMVLESETADV